MDKYIILPDLTCDLSEELRTRFELRDYVKGHVTISDDRDFPTTLDWSNISRDDFYKALSNRKIEVTTSPPNIDEFYSVFSHYAKEGYKVLSMTISSKISSTHGVTTIAAERVRAEIPEAEIYCLDTFKMSGAFGLLVICALELQKAGKSFEEVIAWLESHKHCVHQMGPIDDLMFIARRGRISTGKAIMGNFAGVKPMGDCTRDGFVSVMTKVKGITPALELTARYVKEMATDLENQYVLISHTNRENYANQLKDLILKIAKPKDVLVSDVFVGCGTNIGPGMIGAYFLGDELSADQNTEKDILLRLAETK